VESENRKYTTLALLVFSAICGFIFYKASTQVVDIFKWGGSQVLFGQSWQVVGGVGSGLFAFILFLILTLNEKVTTFLDEVFIELRKTTWPTSKETGASTLVVSIMVGIAGILFFMMDFMWGIVFGILL